MTDMATERRALAERLAKSGVLVTPEWRRAVESVPRELSLTVRPLVLGRDNVPVIADERQAEHDVPLAVLSAMTHGRGPQAPAILKSLASALQTIDADTAAVFVQLVDSLDSPPRPR